MAEAERAERPPEVSVEEQKNKHWLDLVLETFPNSRSMTAEEAAAYHNFLQKMTFKVGIVRSSEKQESSNG